MLSSGWSDQLTEPQQRALELLQALGRHATSFQILESGYHYWFSPDSDAVVTYALRGRRRLVIGAPVVSAQQLLPVTQAFLDDCKASGHRALFVSVERDFCEALGDRVDTLPLGIQSEWQVQEYHTESPRHKSLRAQVRRAARKGVEVSPLSEDQIHADSGALRAEIQGVVDAWQRSRKLRPLRFMVSVQPFHLPSQRRYYLARQEGRCVGVLIAAPVYAREGWFFEDVLRTPNAPNGTVELMIDTAMRQLKDEGALYATQGLCPLAEIPQDPGPHRWKRWGMQWVFEHLNRFYNFQGLVQFKRRFVPHQWTPQYLAVAPGKLGVGEFVALLQALLFDR